MLSCTQQSKTSLLGYGVISTKTRRQLEQEQCTNKAGQFERGFGFSEIEIRIANRNTLILRKIVLAYCILGKNIYQREKL